MSVAPKEFGNAAIRLLRVESPDPSKFPMKSIRGTILSKRTEISKTDRWTISSESHSFNRPMQNFA